MNLLDKSIPSCSVISKWPEDDAAANRRIRVDAGNVFYFGATDGREPIACCTSANTLTSEGIIVLPSPPSLPKRPRHPSSGDDNPQRRQLPLDNHSSYRPAKTYLHVLLHRRKNSSSLI